MRVFAGIPVSQELQKELGKLLKKLERKHWPVKWETPEKLHFTLAFLGNIERVEKLENIVIKACQDFTPFLVKVKGLGCFPDYDWARVIWLGLKGDLKTLASMRKLIREGLKKGGFVIDNKPFSPHVTLGRVKRARVKERKEMARQLKALQKFEVRREWLVDKVVVFESILGRSGSRYRPIKVVKLKK